MEAAEVERDLAAYYDQEGEDRAGRALVPQRVAARDAFISSLEPNRRILEIGIGPGRDAEAFVRAAHTVTGVDLSPVHARLATSVGAHAVVATARALPFPHQAFDVVWSMSTLMHVPDNAIDAALAEIARVLAPAGVAVIGVWGGADVEEHLHNPRYDPPRLFARRSSERWKEMLRRIGTIERYEDWQQGDEPFWYQWALVVRP